MGGGGGDGPVVNEAPQLRRGEGHGGRSEGEQLAGVVGELGRGAAEAEFPGVGIELNKAADPIRGVLGEANALVGEVDDDLGVGGVVVGGAGAGGGGEGGVGAGGGRNGGGGADAVEAVGALGGGFEGEGSAEPAAPLGAEGARKEVVGGGPAERVVVDPQSAAVADRGLDERDIVG